MAKLEAFLPYVALHCMGVPEPSMLHEIRSAAVLFCEQSRAWKRIDSVSVRAGRGEYEIPLEDEAIVVTIEEAIFNNQPLRPEALDALKSEWRDWISQTGTPLLFTQLDPDTLRLVPIPEADQPKGLTLRICYKPDRTAKNVPDWLFQRYAEVIAAGAIARLTAINSLPCFSPGLSAVFGQSFQEGINKALHEADKSFTRAPRRTVPRFM